MSSSRPEFSIPVVRTERLLLRGHRVEDLEGCAAMWGDPKVVRYIGGRPFRREEVWGRIHRYVGHWALLGYGFWAIEERSSGRLVGEVGLADFKRELDEPLPPVPEVGWVLAPWAWGRGYATEAVAAALAWGETNLGMGRAVCLIHPDNAASLKVAHRCGFRETRRTHYHQEPTCVLERAG